MAGQKIKIDIGTSYNGQGIAKLKQGAGGASSAVGKLSKSLGGLKASMKTLGSNLMNIKAGFDMLKGIGSAFMDVFKKAFDFETMTVQFKTLTGSMDEAKEHMKMLKELGDTPPFSLEEFASASRALLVFTDGALGMKGSLEMIGDAAAATGNPLDTVAEAVGRVYATIRDGQPVKRAATQLKNMGLITPALVAEMENLQNAGADNYELWVKLEGALKKYKGAMAETESTGNGLIGAIGSQWDNIVRTFTSSLGKTSKEGLGTLLEKLKEVQDDGSVDIWASRTNKALGSVIGTIKVAGSWIGKMTGWFSTVQDELEKIGSAVGAGIGTMMGDFWNGEKMEAGDEGVWEAMKKAYRDTAAEQKDLMVERVQTEEKLRTEAADRVAKRELENVKKNAKEIKKIKEDMDGFKGWFWDTGTSSSSGGTGTSNGGKGGKKVKPEISDGPIVYDYNEPHETGQANDGKRFQQLEDLYKQEKDLTDELKNLKEEVKQERESRSRIQQGMAANNASSGNGWNGNNRYDNYDYHTDANGNIPLQEVQRAGRMAAGLARDNASAQAGPNRQAALRQELDALQAQEMNNAVDNANAEMNGFAGNKKMSDKDKKRMKELQDYFNQFENTDDKEQTIQNIETKLGQVKTLLERALNAK